MKKQLIKASDIVGLIMKVQEQIAELDKKVDLLIKKPVPQSNERRPSSAPSLQRPNNVHGSGGQKDYHKARPMFRATCADCKKDCELPFRPSGERPVFCRACFSIRRSGNILKVAAGNRPKPAQVVRSLINTTVDVSKPVAKKKKKSVAVKRSGGKKKVASKKTSKKVTKKVAKKAVKKTLKKKK